MSLRQQLAREIVRALGPTGRYTAAPAHDIAEARYSEFSRGIVSHCSLEWLIDRVYRMGGTVTLSVTLPRVPLCRPAPQAPRRPARE